MIDEDIPCIIVYVCIVIHTCNIMALDRCTNKSTYHKGNRCIVTWYILMNSAIRNPKVTSSPSTALSDIRFSDSMHMALTRIIPGTIFPVVSKQVSLEKKILFLDSRYMEQKSNRCPPPLHQFSFTTRNYFFLTVNKATFSLLSQKYVILLQPEQILKYNFWC